MRVAARNLVANPAAFVADMQLGQGADGASATAFYPGVGSGSITYDRQNLPFDFDGTQSVKLTAPNASDINLDFVLSPALDFSQSDYATILVYAPVSSTNFNLVFYFSTQGNFTKFFISPTIQGIALPVGWSSYTISRSQFTTSNGASWNTVNKFRIRLTSINGGGTNTISIARTALGERHSPIFCLTFDDGYASCYSIVKPMLEAAGLRGTFYITKGTVNGGANYMTTAQVKELYDAGHMIGNHFRDHQNNLNNLTAADVTAGWKECEDYLVSIGCPKHAKHACYLGNDGFRVPTSQTYVATKAAGMVSAVTTQDSPSYLPGTRRDRFYIPRISVGLGISDTTVKNRIAEVSKFGGIGMIYAHKIDATESVTADWATSKLQSVVDYIVRLQRQGLITHMTVADVLDAIDSGRRAA